MVLPGPPQKFVVRGVDRRKDDRSNDRFKCLWDRSECDSLPFSSAGELCEHILGHLSSLGDDELSCSWATCSREPLDKQNLRAHVLTHLPSAQPPSKHPTQSDTITLPSPQHPHPMPNPTTRPLPPLKSTLLMKKPIGDPPSKFIDCIALHPRFSFALRLRPSKLRLVLTRITLDFRGSLRKMREWMLWRISASPPLNRRDNGEAGERSMECGNC